MLKCPYLCEDFSLFEKRFDPLVASISGYSLCENLEDFWPSKPEANHELRRASFQKWNDPLGDWTPPKLKANHELRRASLLQKWKDLLGDWTPPSQKLTTTW